MYRRVQLSCGCSIFYEREREREEMERGMLRAVVLVLVLICGISTEYYTVKGQPPTTTFKECYVGCFVLCIIVPPHSLFDCSFQCLKDCLIPKIPQSTATGTHVDNNFNFCKLGCSASLCSNISTEQNPGGDKVESCVGSCSGRCTKTYLSP
ncbi:hypothetical protein RHMOL_Rhmol08G0294100 [Rhododendron molle]|uniref:Uncharacterized protein n=1 Tax=Rhododendron molle TaxID=49168 RepID=A0ACC0MV87_RHOML|nr:hypothetical protein RHMOL_Rhmol08G0294100 [Rhododendron molle]